MGFALFYNMLCCSTHCDNKAKKTLKNLKKSVDKGEWLWYYNQAL